MLPLWFTLWAMVAEYNAHDPYPTAAWLLFIAVPACTITLGMTGATYIVYECTKGPVWRKLKYGGCCLGLFSGAIAIGVAILVMRHERNEQNALAERGRAIVENSPTVARAMRPGFRVSLNSAAIDHDRGRLTYSLSSSDNRDSSLLAIVDVGSYGFSFLCVVPRRAYREEVGADPCRAEGAIAP
jgi:hypothetical protein